MSGRWLEKGDRVHRPGRPGSPGLPEIEDFYGTVLHVGYVFLRRDDDEPDTGVFEKEDSLNRITEPEWENVETFSDGYDYRVKPTVSHAAGFSSVIQRRKKA